MARTGGAVALGVLVAVAAGWLGWTGGVGFGGGALWGMTLLPGMGLALAAWRLERQDLLWRLLGVFVLAYVMAFLAGVLA